jgi:cytochrome c
MRRVFIVTAVGIAALFLQTYSYAAEDLAHRWGLAEAKEHGCIVCHDVDKKKVGPAYKEVSAKYKGKSAADASAAMKALPVHQGALKKTPDADLKLLTEWILSL